MVDLNLYNSPNIAEKIKKRAKLQNVTLKKMLIDCNLGANTISNMLHGKSLASDSLAKIADYLDCSVDYLLGRNIEKKIPAAFKNEQMHEFLELFEKLTSEQQSLIIAQIKGILSNK